MKVLLLLAICYCNLHRASAQSPSFVDPTGTYILKAEIQKNIITGHHGEIRVKLLNEHSVAICFYINTGFPDYKTGSFLDTLLYEDDHIRYKLDSAVPCSLYILFNKESAELQEILTDPSSNCGFGEGVIIPANFRKYSADNPVIEDLSGHGATP